MYRNFKEMELKWLLNIWKDAQAHSIHNMENTDLN